MLIYEKIINEGPCFCCKKRQGLYVSVCNLYIFFYRYQGSINRPFYCCEENAIEIKYGTYKCVYLTDFIPDLLYCYFS